VKFVICPFKLERLDKLSPNHAIFRVNGERRLRYSISTLAFITEDDRRAYDTSQWKIRIRYVYANYKTCQHVYTWQQTGWMSSFSMSFGTHPNRKARTTCSRICAVARLCHCRDGLYKNCLSIVHITCNKMRFTESSQNV